MRAIVHLIKRIPGTSRLAEFARLVYTLARNGSFKTILFAPPGHFYSPLPDLKKIRGSASHRCNEDAVGMAINLRETHQLELLEEFSKYAEELPFNDHPQYPFRYYYSNNYYGAGDAVVLYCMLRHFESKRIIEVGSGFSSAAMLDINDSLCGEKLSLTFIEPHTARLFGLLTAEDRKSCDVITSTVQSIAPVFFQKLQMNDILFIDSSHVSKAGSDLNYLLFEILPTLKPGVIIHFHDILWPFDYPSDWLMQGIAWNETYLLRAFLSYNNAFEILYFNSFIGNHHYTQLSERLPPCAKHIGGSIWLKKKDDR